MRLKADLILLLAALIWGTAFVAQRLASQHVGPFLFNAARYLLAVLVLLPLTGLRWRLKKESLPWILFVGSVLFIASALQQTGIRWTTAGNAGFITGLYVVFVPIILVIGWGQRITRVTWAAVLLAAVGVRLISPANAEYILSPGDTLMLLSAVAWALQVILIGRLAPQVDNLQLAMGQFLVSGLLNLTAGLFFDLPSLPGMAAAWQAVLYAGVFSTSIAFTLQIVGQKHAPASEAAIIMSGEAVFAALAGYLLLGERLAGWQLVGCVLILAAMLLVQLRRNAA